MAKKSSGGLGLTLVAGFALYVFISAYNWVVAHKLWTALIVAGIVAIGFISAALEDSGKEARRKELNEKYNHDEDIVSGILSRSFWKGQTAEQLLDSLGSPEATDKKVLKTKTKEIWKYHEAKKGQFKLKITLENDRVVAWDQAE
jgi:hypothetical protein